MSDPRQTFTARQVAAQLLATLRMMDNATDDRLHRHSIQHGAWPWADVVKAYRHALAKIPGVPLATVERIIDRTCCGEDLDAVLAELAPNTLEAARDQGASEPGTGHLPQTEISTLDDDVNVTVGEAPPLGGTARHMQIGIDLPLDTQAAFAYLDTHSVQQLRDMADMWLRIHDHTSGQPIDYGQLATSFEAIGDAIARWRAGDLTAEQALESVAEQLGA
ncbi:hypothetical protein [Actinomadura miaoliensis]|uniref:Uncharacterized protein n=1 Tax=Actinomadura miaoliensis TaxID=430685 RepID=A0ABP7X1W3_9ACTN